MKHSTFVTLITIILTITLAACSKKADKAEPPAGSTAAPTGTTPPPTGAAAPAGEDDVVAFARTLDEDKLKKILAYEQEMLQHVDLLAGAVGAVAAGGTKAISDNDRYKKLAELTTAALTKAGITQMDSVNFAQLSTELYAKEMALSDGRKKLADDVAKAEKWKPIQAEADKLQGGEQFEFLQKHRDDRPLEDYEKKIYQDQLAELDTDRKAFAAKYGDAVLALLDKYRDQFIAIRQKQLDAVMGRGK